MEKIDITDLLDLVSNIELLYRDSLGLPYDLKFGIEIEYAEAKRHLIRLVLREKYPFWTEVHDDSISANRLNGGEVVSPILNDNKETWETVLSVLKDMKRLGAETNYLTAAHIHFDAHTLPRDLETYFDMLKMWSIFETEIFQFSYGEFDHIRGYYDIYAIPIRSYIKSFHNYTERLINGIKKYSKQANPEKLFFDFLPDFKAAINSYERSAINLENLKTNNDLEKNTLEIRTPNGTLNEIIWQNNINFFAKFLLYFRSDYDQEYINYHFKKQCSKKMDLAKYDVQKAYELANLIFTDSLDSAYFLKQYTRGLKRK